MSEQGHFIVDTASNSAEAFELIEGRKAGYQFILLDELLPETPGERPQQCGIALIQRIKAYDPRIVVVLFRTRDVEQQSLEEALRAGAFRYLPKTYDPQELIVLLRQASEDQQRQRVIRAQPLLERLFDASTKLWNPIVKMRCCRRSWKAFRR